MKNTIKMVLGSMVVYAALAACASDPEGKKLLASIDAGTERDAAPTEDASSEADGNTDTGFLNPVRQARAEKSGTRLRAYRYFGADGAEGQTALGYSQSGRVVRVSRFLDTVLGVDCTILPQTDGDRCLPPVIEDAGGAVDPIETYYGDASCTIGLVMANVGVAPPKYITAVTYLKPNYVHEVYAVGPELPRLASVYLKDGSDCILQSTPPYGTLPASRVVYTLGKDPVAHSNFVSFDYRPE